MDFLVDAPRSRQNFRPFVVVLLLAFAVDSVELDVSGHVCLHLGKKDYRKLVLPGSLPRSFPRVISSADPFVSGCVPRTIQLSGTANSCCVNSNLFLKI